MAAAPVPPSPNSKPPASPAPPLTPATPGAPLPIKSRPIAASNGALITGSTTWPSGLVIQAWLSVCAGCTNNASDSAPITACTTPTGPSPALAAVAAAS
ncbi:hypothetical protein MSS4_05434 [Mycobacterium marinum]|nr:hypothetical protein MSS4_05434 [Mycobacterium marinum]